MSLYQELYSIIKTIQELEVSWPEIQYGPIHRVKFLVQKCLRVHYHVLLKEMHRKCAFGPGTFSVPIKHVIMISFDYGLEILSNLAIRCMFIPTTAFLTLIGKSWKTHPGIIPKFQFSGSWARPFNWKTHPCFRLDALFWMIFPVKRSVSCPKILKLTIGWVLY